MDINFRKIKWKNLLSYGDTFSEIEFSKGIDLVMGSNGQGKSSFNDAIFYSLFGKPFRKIKAGGLINRTTGKKLVVEMEFEIDTTKYKIIRGMKPNKFEIYSKEKGDYALMEQRAATKDYQKFLEEEILNFNETIFRQLMILGANLPNSKPFMDLSTTEKESLFQTLTDTSIFGHVKQVLKNNLSNIKQEIKDLSYKRDIIKSSLDSEKIMIQQSERQNNDFKKNHNTNILMTSDSIKNTEEIIQKYLDGLEKLKKLKTKYDSLDADITVENFELSIQKDKDTEEVEKMLAGNMKTYEGLLANCIISDKDNEKIQDSEKDIFTIKEANQLLMRNKIDIDAKIKYIIGAEKSSIKCKSCNDTNYLTDICDEEVHRKEEYLVEVAKIKVLITEHTKETKKLEFGLMDFKKEVQKTLQDNKNSIQDQKDSMNSNLKELKFQLSEKHTPKEQEIREIRNTLDLYKEKLLNGKRIRDNLLEKKENLKFYEDKLRELKEIKLVEIDYTSIKEKEDTFNLLQENLNASLKNQDDYNYLETIIDGNNLKGVVIKKQIPFLNKGINHFLELFSMLEYSFVIDENFKERLISRDIDSEFGQLSNGQKARISFSIMFAFLKLIEQRNGVKTNLLVLDEVLDSSVDSSGREELLQILKLEFSETKNIIIISHNEQIKEKIELFDRMIHINKDKFSSLSIEDL